MLDIVRADAGTATELTNFRGFGPVCEVAAMTAFGPEWGKDYLSHCRRNLDATTHDFVNPKSVMSGFQANESELKAREKEEKLLCLKIREGMLVFGVEHGESRTHVQT